jgi:hypothetical protein
MIQAAILSVMVAVRRLRPFGARSLSAAFRCAALITVTTLACTGCSNPRAPRPVSVSDVSCVRSVEATGGSFLQAVAHCQRNPFNTSYPAMLDLNGAPDLQKQAFASGYYDRDLPASNSAEVARLQTLQSGLTAAMAVRQKRQGKTVKPLSSTECMTDLLDVPHEAFALGPRWDGSGPSPTNPYLTPQENDCLARQREAASPPVAVAEPAAVTHAALPEPLGTKPSHLPAAPSDKESAKPAHASNGAHTVSPPGAAPNKVLIL